MNVINLLFSEQFYSENCYLFELNCFFFKLLLYRLCICIRVQNFKILHLDIPYVLFNEAATIIFLTDWKKSMLTNSNETISAHTIYLRKNDFLFLNI